MISQIRALKIDDPDTFRDVYTLYHTKLYNYIYNRTRSTEMAQDVVQSSFVKLWENRLKLSEEHTLEVQLFRIAKTILIDELRRDKVKERYVGWAMHTNEQSYQDDVASNNDTIKHVFAEMENLPPIRRKVFKLSRINNYSYKQIAAELDISPKTVETMGRRSMRRFLQCLMISKSLATSSRALVSSRLWQPVMVSMFR